MGGVSCMIIGMGYHKAKVNQYTQVVKLLHIPSRMGCFGQSKARALKQNSEHQQQTSDYLVLAQGMPSLLGQPWASGLATTVSKLPKA